MLNHFDEQSLLWQDNLTMAIILMKNQMIIQDIDHMNLVDAIEAKYTQSSIIFVLP